jgi:hypothetical protein
MSTNMPENLPAENRREKRQAYGYLTAVSSAFYALKSEPINPMLEESLWYDPG